MNLLGVQDGSGSADMQNVFGIANLTSFRSNFAHFYSHLKELLFIAWLFKPVAELNYSAPLTTRLLTGQVQNTF